MKLSVDQVGALLPHRAPMRFVDSVDSVVPGESIVARCEIREGAFWVRGHFPDQPVMPGVLITEALAQAAALVYLVQFPVGSTKAVYLVGLERVRFRRPVLPGQTLILEVSVQEKNSRMWRFFAVAKVDGRRVANAVVLATI